MTATQRLLVLARMVRCRRCNAHVGLDCMAPTGLQASDPCPVRLEDARWAVRLVAG